MLPSVEGIMVEDHTTGGKLIVVTAYTTITTWWR